jgi:ABC-type uncharacterized transport system fused permease/ATPase subunit
MSVYAFYLNQMLQIRWRRWLTRRYLGALLPDHAYYQLRDTTDNPDQRIAEDLNQFTAYVLSLSLGLLTSVVSLVSFLVILWGSPDRRRSLRASGKQYTYLRIWSGQHYSTLVSVLGSRSISIGRWCR